MGRLGQLGFRFEKLPAADQAFITQASLARTLFSEAFHKDFQALDTFRGGRGHPREQIGLQPVLSGELLRQGLVERLGLAGLFLRGAQFVDALGAADQSERLIRDHAVTRTNQ